MVLGEDLIFAINDRWSLNTNSFLTQAVLDEDLIFVINDRLSLNTDCRLSRSDYFLVLGWVFLLHTNY